MKKQSLLLFFIFASLLTYGQKIQELLSPDGNIKISINLSDKIQYDINYQNETLLKDCSLQMDIDNQLLGSNPKLVNARIKSINEQLTPVVPLKYSTVANTYNQLLLKFKGDYSVEFRAYNDGVGSLGLP